MLTSDESAAGAASESADNSPGASVHTLQSQSTSASISKPFKSVQMFFSSSSGEQLS